MLKLFKTPVVQSIDELHINLNSAFERHYSALCEEIIVSLQTYRSQIPNEYLQFTLQETLKQLETTGITSTLENGGRLEEFYEIFTVSETENK